MPLAPLATADDLATRLGVQPYAGLELAQVNELLIDASAEMRSIVGTSINRLTSTVTLFADRRGRVDIPAVPVISVASVLHEGVALASTEWKLRYRTLYLPTTVDQFDELVVTFTHGWDPIPDDIVRWTCILAVAMKAAADESETLGLAAGVVQRSEAIDDYQVTTQGPQAAGETDIGLTLPPRIADRLRASYGASGLMDWLEVSG